MSVEYLQTNTVDIWWKLQGCGSKGATEDEFVNTFRSAIKIKPGADKKVVRFDKIIYKGTALKPKLINIIGEQPMGDLVPIDGLDADGEKYVTHAHLFPSDHFGLVAEFKRTY